MTTSCLRWPLAVSCFLMLVPQTIRAQDDGATDYVPAMSVAVMRSKPMPTLEGPGMEYMPIEIAQAWARENFGVDLMAIGEVKLVFGMPMPGSPPPFGILIRFSEDFDPANINPDLLAEAGPIKVVDRDVYVLGTQNKAYLHAVNPRTVIVASPGFFEMMVESQPDGGAVADLMRRYPLGENDGQVIVAIEPIRPLLVAQVEQQADQLPVELQGLTKIPELLEAVIYENVSTQFRLQLVCDDASAAEELSEIVERGIEFARVMAIAEMTRNIQGEGRMPEAQRAYFTRLANHFAGLIQPQQENNRLVLEADMPNSMVQTGVLVALLLPAVQAAREAARRTSAANNLKQIGIAMHNYHDAYNEFPATAITDDDGTPLLSWRVAILPFIEQQALYEQFHLNEPWDSDHNIKLVEQMPPVFADPSLPLLPSGMTVFHAAAGEGMALESGRENRIRDITDGTVNTILVVEADEHEAVQWTEPRDVDIDMDQPIDQMGHIHPGGFQVLFADGSVRFIAHVVDTVLFRALLTRNGGENVAGF